MRPKLRIEAEDAKRSTWPYFHVVIDPKIIDEIKAEAAKRGMKIGKFTERLLEFALEHLSD